MTPRLSVKPRSFIPWKTGSLRIKNNKMDLPGTRAKVASNMQNIFKIAWRNLFRYTRRTLLTGSLIAMGVGLVIVFTGVGNSFKNGVIDRITNSNLGHIQIHRDGYISAIDSQPLNKGIGTQDL